MTLERYLQLGLCKTFEWMEQKSKDVLKLTEAPGGGFAISLIAK